MKAAILGVNGQMGRALAGRYPDAVRLAHADLDIADAEVVQTFEWADLDIIFNAAAYTRVDNAETVDGRRWAWQANATGPRHLAEVAARHGITLVHVSSDYVFDGTESFHTETEPLTPLGVYGQSKAAGDLAVSLAPDHYILRASWLIGDGPNFVRTMRQAADQNEQVSVVEDQIGRLTFTGQLIDAIDHLLSTRPAPGTYNCSNDGAAASWADIARAVYVSAGHSPTLVTAIDTAEYVKARPKAAPRPRHSTLDLAKIKSTGLSPVDWNTALDAYLRWDPR